MAAPAYPSWVIFEHYCKLEVQGCSSSIADTNTVARCRTSTGHPIDVSLCLAAPPEVSRVCVQLPRGIVASHALVVAAHGDSVVVKIGQIKDRRTFTYSTDIFVYCAGDAAAKPPRPPSLSLLPPHSITYEDEVRRPGCNYLDTYTTGFLSRGEGDFVVVELTMEYVKDERYDKVHKEAALHLLRSSSCRWCVKRPMISGYADAGEGVDDLASWSANYSVIPIGDQMLCWVDLPRGILFSNDLFDESPSLQYVALPEDTDVAMRNVCATGDGSSIKVVNVFPHCSCRGAGKSKCRVSHHAYTIHTWTLRIDVDMAWVMDGSLDTTQLWSLDGYKGLPHVELDNAIVSMDKPDAICFVVCENHHEKTRRWDDVADHGRYE